MVPVVYPVSHDADRGDKNEVLRMHRPTRWIVALFVLCFSFQPYHVYIGRALDQIGNRVGRLRSLRRGKQ